MQTLKREDAALPTTRGYTPGQSICNVLRRVQNRSSHLLGSALRCKVTPLEHKLSSHNATLACRAERAWRSALDRQQYYTRHKENALVVL